MPFLSSVGILDERAIAEVRTERTGVISPHVIFGLCGFTLYLTWTFVLFISPAVTPESSLSALNVSSVIPTKYLARFAMLLAIFVSLVVCRMRADHLSTKRGILFMIFGSLSLVTLSLIALSFFGAIPLVSYLALALLGIAQCFMILLWSSFLSVIGERKILLFTAICVGSAALLTILMLFLQPHASVWITYSLCWATMGCYAFVYYKHPETRRPLSVEASASDRRSTIKTKSALSVVLYSVALGFAVYFIATQETGVVGPLIAGLAVLLASIIVILDSTRFHLISEGVLVKLHLPFILIGLVPMFFTNAVIRMIGVAMIFLFFMIIFILNIAALSEHIRIDRLNSIRIFGYGRSGNVLGFSIGAFVCFLAFIAPQIYDISGSLGEQNWANIILLSILGIFTIGVSFIFEDHFPVDVASDDYDQRRTDRDAYSSGATRSLSNHVLSATGGFPGSQSGAWRKRVNALSSEYGLSPRENEVLHLLAKGRNAEFIQDELVVSRHTAKAHIYHIYQKTGVHSRQELIDMLEEMDIDRG